MKSFAVAFVLTAIAFSAIATINPNALRAARELNQTANSYIKIAYSCKNFSGMSRYRLAKEQYFSEVKDLVPKQYYAAVVGIALAENGTPWAHAIDRMDKKMAEVRGDHEVKRSICDQLIDEAFEALRAARSAMNTAIEEG